MASPSYSVVSAFSPGDLQAEVQRMITYEYWQPIIGVSVLSNGLITQPIVRDSYSPQGPPYPITTYNLIASNLLSDLTARVHEIFSVYADYPPWPLGMMVETPSGILLKPIVSYVY